jgi:hypothetical protein
MAGLLTYTLFEGLPTRQSTDSDYPEFKKLTVITAAGTVAEFLPPSKFWKARHGIPFSDCSRNKNVCTIYAKTKVWEYSKSGWRNS